MIFVEVFHSHNFFFIRIADCSFDILFRLNSIAFFNSQHDEILKKNVFMFLPLLIIVHRTYF